MEAQAERVFKVRLQGKAQRCRRQANWPATWRQEAGRQTALAAAEDFGGEFAELELLVLLDHEYREIVFVWGRKLADSASI